MHTHTDTHAHTEHTPPPHFMACFRHQRELSRAERELTIVLTGIRSHPQLHFSSLRWGL